MYVGERSGPRTYNIELSLHVFFFNSLEIGSYWIGLSIVRGRTDRGAWKGRGNSAFVRVKGIVTRKAIIGLLQVNEP